MRTITYPEPGDDFTISDFRDSGAAPVPNYYLHVVNDETGVCKCIEQHYSLSRLMSAFRLLSDECAEGWHLEITIGLNAGETRARLM